MDSIETLNNPTLLTGFNELLEDPDVHVVKRTIRVFTNVYTHSLRLLTEDKISEEILLNAWPYMSDVVDNLFKMFISTENEGILVILVKFLECSVDRHLNCDFSKYREIYKRSREYIKRGLRALKDLVSTPYVGGSVFIVGTKALIRISCLREDLYEPVTDLVKRLLDDLPPTLFDHNVRSMNKILQFNLFRLLKKSNCDTLKRRLIDMMVSVGAARKSLLQWAPKHIVVPKRKIPQQNIDDLILGRISPPHKRSKLDESDVIVEDIKLTTIDMLIPEPCFTGLQFLSSLIPISTKKEEKEIFDKLSLCKVCSLILSNLHYLPDSMPTSFPANFSEKTVVSEDIGIMRTHLATMLVSQFDYAQLKSFSIPVTNIPSISNSVEVQSFSSPATSIPVVANPVEAQPFSSPATNIPLAANRQAKSLSPPATKIPLITKSSSEILNRDTIKEECDNKADIFSMSDVDMRKIVMNCKKLLDVDMRVNSNAPEVQYTPSHVNDSPKENQDSKIVNPSNNCSSVSIREDPRIKGKLCIKTSSPKSSPIGSPQGSPTEDIETKFIGQDSNNEPLLQNRTSPQATASKENIRVDPRLSGGNIRPRDPRRTPQFFNNPENIYINSNMLNNQTINNVPNQYSNNVPNHMLSNILYESKIDFQNQFQPNMRVHRNFNPQFDYQSHVRFQNNFNNRVGLMNNFNNLYPYQIQHGFQPL